MPIWLPPSARDPHVFWCEMCDNPIDKGKVVFWEIDPTGEDSDQVIKLCPDCVKRYREDQWWAGERRKRALEILEKYGALPREMWPQEEIDSRAEHWGIEKRRKWF